MLRTGALESLLMLQRIVVRLPRVSGADCCDDEGESTYLSLTAHLPSQ